MTTGAPVPDGFTSVVPIEEIIKETADGEQVRVKPTATVKEG